MINLENMKVGKLRVIKRVGGKWECICDCGNKYFANTTNLRIGHVTSCGCKKRPNLVGMQFYRLKVLRLIGTDKNGHRKWECKCDCGKITTAVNSKLTSGRKQSCGCKKREDAIKRQWKGHGEISGSLWHRITSQAKMRNFEVSITIYDAWDLFLEQDRKCRLTGMPLDFSSGYVKTDGTASLDRINSKLGYIKGNIQWIHKTVNQMKMDLDENVFVELCRKIVKTNDERKIKK